MPRKAREKSLTGVYHVMMRGINRQRIFIDGADFQYFESILFGMANFIPKDQNTPSKTPCEFYAYALMDNHLHLLIKEVDDSLGDIIKSMACSYVYYFNHRHRRCGHLFQERFKSEPVEDDQYFITLLRYIHQNPVKAKMVPDAALYRFSSWKDYNSQAALKICNTDEVLKKISLAELSELVHEPVHDKEIGLLNRRRNIGFSDSKALSFLKSQYGIKDAGALKELGKKERNPILMELLKQGVGISQLAQLTGISKMALYRLGKKLE